MSVCAGISAFICIFVCVFPVYLLAQWGEAGTAACKPLQLLESKCSLPGMGRTSWEWGFSGETGQTQTPALMELAPETTIP